MPKVVSQSREASSNSSEIVLINSSNLENYLQDILEIEGLCFDDSWTDNMFIEEVHNPVSRMMGILVNSELAGYICFWKVKDEIHLMNLAIHPYMRRMGLGKRLLSRMIAEAKDSGIKCIMLEVQEDNINAITLYRDFGFKVMGRRPLYYKESERDALLMESRLGEQ